MEKNIYEVKMLVQKPCPESSVAACESLDHCSKLSGGEAVHRYIRAGFIIGSHLKNATETQCEEHNESLVDVLESKKIGKVGI
jgi:hypothetical protein